MINFKNQNILITGGSRGIGKACVELFLNADANVAFTYQSSKKDAEKILNDYTGSSILKCYQVNFSDSNEIDKTVGSVLDDFERIDAELPGGGAGGSGGGVPA